MSVRLKQLKKPAQKAGLLKSLNDFLRSYFINMTFWTAASPVLAWACTR